MRPPPAWAWTRSYVDPKLEAAFQADFADRTLGYLRGCAVLLPLLFAAFGPVDAIVAPARAATLWAIRYGLVVPLLAAFVPIWWSERSRALLRRHLHEVLAFQAVITFAGLVAIAVVEAPAAGRPYLEVSAGGLLVSASFLYGMSRLRVAYALPVGLGASLAGAIVGAAHPTATTDLVVAGAFYVVVTNGIGAWIAYTLEEMARRDFLLRRELLHAQARSDALLRAVLPGPIVDRLRTAERPTFAERHPEVTVVLADVAGFTPLAGRLPPAELAALLDALFTRFDALCERHGAVKVKTLGDGWLACAGAPEARGDHAEAGVGLARDMLAAFDEVRRRVAEPLGLRIGVATGPVVAGVIGRTRFAWDLWGEAVREAQEMEHGGAVGRVRVAPSTAARLSAHEIVDEDGRLWLR